MATPPGNLQSSSQSENQKGNTALTQARTQILQSQDHVKTTMGSLTRTYGGADGTAYRQLLSDWSGQVDLIVRNIDQMIQKLQETSAHQASLQTNTGDQIRTAGAKNNVFDQLMG
ncbi:hypothetical protein [Streptomyces roseicoloratus]|uniref:hypothetical protein n=1 Tax=Streptomyces roseicoloratus TaxID=2508722 RepID=UPI001009DED2|nr:hypothetical protein [Streptomyces roseicoloratus]